LISLAFEAEKLETMSYIAEPNRSLMIGKSQSYPVNNGINAMFVNDATAVY
jgi:hypothetical protein